MPRGPSGADSLFAALLLTAVVLGVAYAIAALVGEPSSWSAMNHGWLIGSACLTGTVLGIGLARRGSADAARRYAEDRATAELEAGMREPLDL